VALPEGHDPNSFFVQSGDAHQRHRTHLARIHPHPVVRTNRARF
jgi:hypothetical protein